VTDKKSPIHFLIITIGKLLGMLNDYRIFDYWIKCSFSFSFVTHSIIEILR